LHLSLIYGVQIGTHGSAAPGRIEAHLSSTPPPQRLHRHAPAAPANASAAQTVPPATCEPLRVLSSPIAIASTEDVTPARRPEEDKLRPDLDVPVITDPVWYEARDLDLFPRPLDPVVPEYSTAASKSTRGELTLPLCIDEYGTVQEAQVVKAEPPSYFEPAALTAFRSAHFAPAQRDGRAVRSLIAVRVRMEPPRTPGPEQETAR
jgi:protein TonB